MITSEVVTTIFVQCLDSICCLHVPTLYASMPFEEGCAQHSATVWEVKKATYCIRRAPSRHYHEQRRRTRICGRIFVDTSLGAGRRSEPLSLRRANHHP